MSPLPLPGRDVTRADRPRGRQSAGTTGQAFFVGETEGGPLQGTARSLDDFVRDTGARVSFGSLYDAVEGFFREGGSILNWSRIVSSTATTAQLDLSNGTAATLRVVAGGPGSYGNGLSARVLTNAQDSTIPVGQFTVEVRITATGEVIESTPPVADEVSAIGYAAANWRRAKLIDQPASGNPVAVAWTALAGGNDNRGAITDNDRQIALDRFPAWMGPGQVAAPGATTSTAHLQVIAHAVTRNRHALLDAVDTPTVSTLTTLADADNLAPSNGGRVAALLWPWGVAPGLAPFTTRVVPLSGPHAGLIARLDALGNPGEPSAGEDPRKAYRWLIGLSQSNPIDSDRLTLNDRGVNVALMVPDGGGGQRPVMYGNRTLRRELQDPNWLQASGSRTCMAIQAEADAIMAPLVHELNQKGVLMGKLSGDLAVMLGRYFRVGALYGDTPQQAFAVDVGPSLNTDASIASGRLRASIAVRTTPGADRVSLELVRVAITEAVA